MVWKHCQEWPLNMTWSSPNNKRKRKENLTSLRASGATRQQHTISYRTCTRTLILLHWDQKNEHTTILIPPRIGESRQRKPCPGPSTGMGRSLLHLRKRTTVALRGIKGSDGGKQVAEESLLLMATWKHGVFSTECEPLIREESKI